MVALHGFPMMWSEGRALPGNRWDLLDGIEPLDPPMVSVIVSHYRQPEQLARCLYALRRQDHPAGRLEVIVADDGSPERPDVPDGVRLVRHEDAGFRLAAVRNLGARAALGEVLVFVDADMAPEPDFIRRLVRLPSLAPDCVTVGRRRHADLAGLDPGADVEGVAPERELTEPTWLSDAYRASRNLLDADDRSYRFVIGAVLACSRRMFEEVGGFEEAFTSYGGEDWEWAYRAWVRGALLAHVPEAVAWHDGPDIVGRSSAALASKNAEVIRLAELIPLPGSRGRGLRTAKVDIAVAGPPSGATPGQAFISVDSVLAVLPGAEAVNGPDGLLRDDDGRLDRVRIRIEILRPVRVDGRALAAEVGRAAVAQLGELVLVDDDGAEVIRIVSMRARARNARWGRDDLFPVERSICHDLHAVSNEVDVEAYVGGWA
ncbi:MAG: glycosyltransferase [Microbacterium sp.]